MKKWMGILAVTMLTVSMLILFKTEYDMSSAIVINEVCSRNGFLKVNEAYLGEDYIELYNTTNQPINLNGWWLSDNIEETHKNCLGDITIEANGFILLYADGRSEGTYSLNFKISPDGEKLILSDAEGKQMDLVYVPALEMDTVYGRTKDGGDSWETLNATPGMSNNKAEKAEAVSLGAPILSHVSGFYDEEFQLTMKAEKGVKIYYTLDGSIPTEDSILYQEPICIKKKIDSKSVLNTEKRVAADWNDYMPIESSVDKATVIRAIVSDGKGNVSKVVTETYLVGLEEYKNCNVISITADYEHLLGENGIFVTGEEYDQWYLTSPMFSDGVFEEGWTDNHDLTNFWKHGRSTEVLANIQYFQNGAEVLNQNTGLRVQGNAARMNLKKNLQLFSRRSYSGNSIFEKQFFEGYDSHSVYASASPEKAYCLGLVENRSLGLQNIEKAALFINGEYWYDATLMEKFDEYYIEQHYGVDSDNVLMIKDTLPAAGEEYYYIYEDLIEYMRNTEISNEEKCSVLYEIFDVQSIIDWMCFNLYVCNNDVSYKKNCIYWRTIEPEDGNYGDCKWRWLLYDVDHAATWVAAESENFKEFSIVSDNRFYWALSSSEHFCRQFVLTALDMMNTNFSLENVEAVLGEWGLDLSYGNDFFKKRPEHMLKSLKNEFGLTGTLEEVTVAVNDTEGGRIHINTITPELEDGTWTGMYLTDFPVTITVEANPGYRFVGWNNDCSITDETIKVDVIAGGICLTAVFEKE